MLKDCLIFCRFKIKSYLCNILKNINNVMNDICWNLIENDLNKKLFKNKNDKNRVIKRTIDDQYIYLICGYQEFHEIKYVENLIDKKGFLYIGLRHNNGIPTKKGKSLSLYKVELEKVVNHDFKQYKSERFLLHLNKDDLNVLKDNIKVFDNSGNIHIFTLRKVYDITYI